MPIPAASAALVSLALIAVSTSACSSGSKSTASTGSTGSSVNAVSNGGSGSSPAAAGKAVKACELLTAAEASTAAKQVYKTATSSVSDPAMCNYSGSAVGFFTIISPGAGDAAWKDQLNTLQSDGGSTPVTIPGLGERAAGCGTEIGVQYHGYIIDVHGGDSNSSAGSPRFESSIALAKVIVSHLP